jgi:hypothetical protein
MVGNLETTTSRGARPKINSRRKARVSLGLFTNGTPEYHDVESAEANIIP